MTPIHFLNHSALVHITDPDEHCQKNWVKGNFYEAQKNGLLVWAYNNIPHNGIYIDIGANLGNHSLFMWRVLNGKQVYSIEADRKHYMELLNNTLANHLSQQFLFNIALSDFNGFGELAYDKTPVSQGGAMMGKLIPNGAGEIAVMTLDSFISNWVTGRVTWMKLDIEGSELKALIGGEKFINDNKPQFISCECMNDSDKNNIDSFLAGLGYSIASPQLNHTPTFVWKHRGA